MNKMLTSEKFKEFKQLVVVPVKVEGGGEGR